MTMRSKDNHLDFYLENMLENDDFVQVIQDDQDQEEIDKIDIPDTLPILPLRNTVLFPGVVIPISVGRPKSKALIRHAWDNDRLIGTVSQKTPKVSEPQDKDLFDVGTLARILKVLRMPDESTTVIIQGRKRFEIDEIIKDEPFFEANVSPLFESYPDIENEQFKGLIASLKELSQTVIQLSRNIPPEASFAINNIDNPVFLINFISSNSDITIKDKQALLEVDNIEERGIRLLEYLTQEVQRLEIKDDIQSKVKGEIDRQQREYFLNQQMKTIQNELGQDPVSIDIEEMRKKAKKKKWGKEVKAVFDKEIKRLERMNPAAPDYSNQLTYLQTLLELPWNIYTKDNFDLKRAKKVLDRDHFGMEQVKERILEHLAVLKLKGDLKSPIICLYGPPGVGKTSLGKSIAEALNRNYIRMSLGGLHDEAEIRGHRKTYIGALPGRIIQNLKKAKSSNPVFVLDEIDKVGKDFRGDPSFALLEVLDPEQNSTFYDNYLEVEYDLSKVLFIATANTLAPINSALRDRMEMIDVSGYIVEEKIEIAKRHLIPKQLKNHGLKKSQVKFPKNVIETIIMEYTRESGVRELDKKIAKVVRAIAKKIGFEQAYNPRLKISDIREILGPPEYIKHKYQGNKYAGVVTGLAWTQAGGKILYVETSLSHGKGNLTITGNLGDVMKESGIIAMEYLKAHATELGIENHEIFDKWNVHVHVPEGAIPKDGPSAGITMLTSIASAFTQRKVKLGIAMTGEITLRGKILPVGGIKEKILAAKRANINEIILSKDNKKDVEVINERYLEGLELHYVDTIMEVLDIALLEEKVKNSKKIINK